MKRETAQGLPGGATPITVVGGYLGAGKTTLVNALLASADRRLGVIVNDFGELGIDARLLSGGDSAAGIVNLANGCVCCTLGDDLRTALDQLAAAHVDHIVVEASGVADPVVTAAWGTVPGFERGGTVVLAAADSVVSAAADRYVGGEVLRQIEGADIILLTKTDVCASDEAHRVSEWIADRSDAPVVVAVGGDVPPEVVLGAGTLGRPSASDRRSTTGSGHPYDTWSYENPEAVDASGVHAFVDALPTGVIRLKGVAEARSGDAGGAASHLVMQCVGRSRFVEAGHAGLDTYTGVAIEAIGVRGRLSRTDLDALAVKYLSNR